MYSPSQGVVYCFVCKLFSNNIIKRSPFANDGFCDWKKSDKVSQHENSLEHKNSTTKWLNGSSSLALVNTELCRQITIEKDYWIQVMKRITSVIKFLALRGLAFRGDNEKFGVNNNGNYLGLLELIANFDPFFKNHIDAYGNKG